MALWHQDHLFCTGKPHAKEELWAWKRLPREQSQSNQAFLSLLFSLLIELLRKSFPGLGMMS